MKLTVWKREQIEKRLLAHRFDAEEAKIEADKQALADAVYKDVYSRKALSQMDALPSDWLPTRDWLDIRFGEDGSRYTRLPLPEPRRVKASHEHGCIKVYDDKHPLSLRWAAIWQRVQDLRNERDALRSKLKATLNSCSTVKRLTEVWPEVAPFVGDVAGTPINLPAVPVKELNAALKLKAA